MPGWLIVLPKRPALNFKKWSRGGGSPASVLAAIATRLGIHSGEYLWFEHGPATRGSEVGCGVDYAHLHMLVRPPFTFEQLAERAMAGTPLVWTDTNIQTAYAKSNTDSSYLLIGQGERAIEARDVEIVGSQYLRRAVAQVVGCEDAWNYRQDPQEENVALTVERIRALESAASHGN